MPRTYKPTGKKPGRPRKYPKDIGDGKTDEQKKAERQERAALAKQKAIEACGPLKELPAVPPTLFEDMRRAWQCEEHPLDGPGVLNLRKMVKADFLGFMKLYRDEEKRAADLGAAREENALLKAEVAVLRAGVVAVGAAEAADGGSEAALELVEWLLAEAVGEGTR